VIRQKSSAIPQRPASASLGALSDCGSLTIASKQTMVMLCHGLAGRADARRHAASAPDRVGGRGSNGRVVLGGGVGQRADRPTPPSKRLLFRLP